MEKDLSFLNLQISSLSDTEKQILAYIAISIQKGKLYYRQYVIKNKMFHFSSFILYLCDDFTTTLMSLV